MENFEKIEKLVKSKSYDSLTDKEKVLVQDFTKEEYDSFRLTLLNVSSGFSYEKPNPKIKENLLKEFHSANAPIENNKKKGLWAFLFPQGTSFIMKPGLQIGFASVVFVLGGWFFSNMNFNKSENLAQNNVELNEESKTETIKKENLEEEEEYSSTDEVMLTSNNEQVLAENQNNDSSEVLPVESEKKDFEDLNKLVEKYKGSTPYTELADEKANLKDSDEVFMAGISIEKEEFISNEDMSVSVAEDSGLLDLLSATY